MLEANCIPNERDGEDKELPDNLNSEIVHSCTPLHQGLLKNTKNKPSLPIISANDLEDDTIIILGNSQE